MKNTCSIALCIFIATALLAAPFSAEVEVSNEPPYTLRFSTVEQFQELVDATELSEENFMEFLNTKHPDYTINGISDKEDAIILINELYDIIVPILISGEILYIDYYMESKAIEITSQSSNKITIISNCSIEEADTELTIEKTLTFDNLPMVEKIKATSTNRFIYKTEADNKIVWIYVYTKDEALAENILSEMELSSLRSLCAKEKENVESTIDIPKDITENIETDTTTTDIVDKENPNTADHDVIYLLATASSIILCVFLLKKMKTTQGSEN